MAGRAELERLDRDEAAGPIDLATWEQEPSDEQLTESFWQDPEPDFQGMLSADRIRAYHYAVGRMIRPFQEERLKPASYELTLGPRWLLNGEVRYLTPEQPLLEIPPNSIVFASMREMLLLPHWLAGRFDLAIAFIYKGLLLGTGPQVDPGFKGVLSCPLHNISARPIVLKYGEPFAKMDFTKTSFSNPALPTLASESQLYELAAKGELEGYDGTDRVLWTQEKNFRPPILFAEDVKLVRSSLLDLGQKIKKARKQVGKFGRRLRRGEIGIAIGLVALVLGIGTFMVTYVNRQVDDAQSRPELQRLQRETRVLNRDLLQAEARARGLQREIAQLERSAAAP